MFLVYVIPGMGRPFMFMCMYQYLHFFTLRVLSNYVNKENIKFNQFCFENICIFALWYTLNPLPPHHLIKVSELIKNFNMPIVFKILNVAILKCLLHFIFPKIFATFTQEKCPFNIEKEHTCLTHKNSTCVNYIYHS